MLSVTACSSFSFLPSRLMSTHVANTCTSHARPNIGNHLNAPVANKPLPRMPGHIDLGWVGPWRYTDEGPHQHRRSEMPIDVHRERDGYIYMQSVAVQLSQTRVKHRVRHGPLVRQPMPAGEHSLSAGGLMSASALRASIRKAFMS